MPVPPARRPSLPVTAANHEERIRALERQRPQAASSDYVLIATNEIVDGEGIICDGNGIQTGVDDDPMEFGDVAPCDPIPQTYLHLVLELSVKSTATTEFLMGVYGVPYDDLVIIPGTPTSEEDGVNSWRAERSPNATTDPDTPVDLGGGSYGSSAIFIPGALPPIDFTGGDAGADAWFTSVTVKFLYYSRADRVHGIVWQASGLMPGGVDGAELVPYHATGGGVWPLDLPGKALGQMTILGWNSGLADGSLGSLYGIKGGCLTPPPPEPEAMVTVTINGATSDPVPLLDASLDALALTGFFTGTINRRFDDVLVGATPGGSDYFSDDFAGATLVPPWDNTFGGAALDSGSLLISPDGSVNKNLSPPLPVYVRFQFRLDASDSQDGFFFVFNCTDTGFIVIEMPGGSWSVETDGGSSTFGTVVTDTWVQVDIAIEAV